jgi:Ala-tRNA(Pro) deacylase
MRPSRDVVQVGRDDEDRAVVGADRALIQISGVDASVFFLHSPGLAGVSLARAGANGYLAPLSLAKSMQKSPEDLFAYLDSMSIETATVDHPPLHTVEDSQALRGDIPGGHTKNLFIKDKKGRLFLLVLGEETAVDLKRVHEKIGAQGRVSFGSAELLEEVWGVQPGAVTPFGAINDEDGRVSVVLDEAMMVHERLNFHPLVNTRTTGLASADLVRFLRETGHEPLIVALGQEDTPLNKPLPTSI